MNRSADVTHPYKNGFVQGLVLTQRGKATQ